MCQYKKVEPGRCRWNSGLSSAAKSARHWTPVHPAHTLRPKTERASKEEHKRLWVCSRTCFEKHLCTLDSTAPSGSRGERRALAGRRGAHRKRCPWHTCSAGRGWRGRRRCERDGGRRPRTGRSRKRGSSYLKGRDVSTGLDKISSDSSLPHSDERKTNKQNLN